MIDALRKHGSIEVRHVRPGDVIAAGETVEVAGAHHSAHGGVAWRPLGEVAAQVVDQAAAMMGERDA